MSTCSPRAISVRPSLALGLAALALAGACSSNQVADPKPDAALRDLAEQSPSGQELTSGDCALVAAAQVAEAAATPLHAAFQTDTSFSLPGMKEVEAERCDFEFVRGERLHVVTIRVARTKANALLAALERIDSAALRPVEAGVFPTTAVTAYWQTVGTTMWVRSGERFISIEVVAEAPTEGDFDLAAALARLVLGLEQGQ